MLGFKQQPILANEESVLRLELVIIIIIIIIITIKLLYEVLV